MEIIKIASSMQAWAITQKRAGKIIGFVPTMGFLHEGHLSLMRMARKQCDLLVASIFVNPTQFGPNEDFESYPRNFEGDEQLCRAEGVDLLFYPDASTMYAPDASAWVDEEVLSQFLCGASRPGHFRGVCTVVAKLFNLVLPDLSVFGEKDAQQLRVIERFVRDLNFPVRIVRGPIVREADGLAMSSRNKYLNEEDRKNAGCLRRALTEAQFMYDQGERDPIKIIKMMGELIGHIPNAEIDYIEVVDDASLAKVEHIYDAVLIALAVKFGATRLIDNLSLGKKPKFCE